MDKREKFVLDQISFLQVNNSTKHEIRVRYPCPIVSPLSLAFFLANIERGVGYKEYSKGRIYRI